MYAADPWYLIRTKSNRERFVREQLAPIVSDIFLPMLKLPFTRSHRASPSLVPLFPQYIFARLHQQYAEARPAPAAATHCKPRTSPYAFQGLGKKASRSSPRRARRPAWPSSPRSWPSKTSTSSPSTPTSSRSAPATCRTTTSSTPSAKRPSPCSSSAASAAPSRNCSCRRVHPRPRQPQRHPLRARHPHFEKATRNTLDISAVPVAQELSHLPVVIDPATRTGLRAPGRPARQGRGRRRRRRHHHRGAPAPRKGALRRPPEPDARDVRDPRSTSFGPSPRPSASRWENQPSDRRHRRPGPDRRLLRRGAHETSTGARGRRHPQGGDRAPRPQMGILAEAGTDLAAVADADVVVLATPVRTLPAPDSRKSLPWSPGGRSSPTSEARRRTSSRPSPGPARGGRGGRPSHGGQRAGRPGRVRREAVRTADPGC